MAELSICCFFVPVSLVNIVSAQSANTMGVSTLHLCQQPPYVSAHTMGYQLGVWVSGVSTRNVFSIRVFKGSIKAVVYSNNSMKGQQQKCS